MDQKPDGTENVPQNTNEPTPVEPVKTDDEKAGLVEEIKQLRTERATYKELLDAELTKKAETQPLDDVSKKVEEILRQKETARAQANKKAALEKFITEHKEFAEGNDPAGIKRQALERKFAMFNTDGLIEVNDYELVIRDAHRLLVGTDKPPVISKENTYSSGIPNSGAEPKATDGDMELSPKERKLSEQFNYPKEKILKLRVTKPDFLDELLEHVRD